jgi:hypothetical protein
MYSSAADLQGNRIIALMASDPRWRWIWQLLLRGRLHMRLCTGNGLVVPSSSHKQEFAGSIPDGCTKTCLFSLPLLPHRLMSYFDVWRHLSFHENPHKTLQQQDNSSTRPRGEKEGATTTVYWRGAERGEFYRAISKGLSTRAISHTNPHTIRCTIC